MSSPSQPSLPYGFLTAPALLREDRERNRQGAYRLQGPLGNDVFQFSSMTPSTKSSTSPKLDRPRPLTRAWSRQIPLASPWEVVAMPRGGAPKRPKNLRRTLRTFFAYLGHGHVVATVAVDRDLVGGDSQVVGEPRHGRPLVHAPVRDLEEGRPEGRVGDGIGVGGEEGLQTAAGFGVRCADVCLADLAGEHVVRRGIKDVLVGGSCTSAAPHTPHEPLKVKALSWKEGGLFVAVAMNVPLVSVEPNARRPSSRMPRLV